MLQAFKKKYQSCSPTLNLCLRDIHVGMNNLKSNGTDTHPLSQINGS